MLKTSLFMGIGGFSGTLYGLAEKENLLTNELRLLLAVGFCGSFTTFPYEKMQLIHQGERIIFSIYTVSSVVLGILAAVSGVALVKLF